MALGTYPVITLPNGYRLSLFNVVGAKLSGTVLIFDLLGNTPPMRYDCGADTIAQTLIAQYDTLVSSQILGTAPTVTSPSTGSPTNASYSGTDYQIELVGTNFTPGAVLVINGITIGTSLSSSTILFSANIPVHTFAIGTYDIKLLLSDGQNTTVVGGLVVGA